MKDIKIPKVTCKDPIEVNGAIIEEVICLQIQNRSTYRGEYDSSEDWEIQAYGSTLEEAITNMVPVFISSGVFPDGHDIMRVTRLKYDDEYWYQKDDDPELVTEEGERWKPIMSLNDVIYKITHDPLYIRIKEEEKRLEDERARRLEKERKEREAKLRKAEKKQKKKDDIAKLHELLAMYPGEVPGT